MGADLIGWRGCPLQEELGPDGFLGKFKLRSYLTAVAVQVSPDKRAEVKVAVLVHGPDGPSERELRYADMESEVAAFLAGIPECATCPLSDGRPVSCYHYVPYPIDEVFERLVFDFFVSQIGTADSICDQLWRSLVSQVPDHGTGWHQRRGTDPRTGALARLPDPLVHRFGGLFRKRTVDSAQILQSLFVTLDRPALVVAYGLFFAELLAFASDRGITSETSPTLAAVEGYARMLLATVEGAVSDGWAVLTDA